MRTPRAAAAAVLLSVLGLLTTAGQPAAQADGPVPTGVTLQRVTPTGYNAVYHDSTAPVPDPLPSVPGVDAIDYRATLTASGLPLAGEQVSLQRMLEGQAAWHEVASATTDSDGAADFSTPVRGNATYQVTYAGNPVLAPATSVPVALEAMRDFNSRITLKHGEPYLQGNINPAWGHHKVSWEKRRCETCRWRTIQVARTRANGGWRFRGAFAPVGTVWGFRAAIGARGRFIASTSSIMNTTHRAGSRGRQPIGVSR